MLAESLNIPLSCQLCIMNLILFQKTAWDFLDTLSVAFTKTLKKQKQMPKSNVFIWGGGKTQIYNVYTCVTRGSKK